MRITVPFLGGPISAILVFLALEPNGPQAVMWVALVPLLHSLHRHRHNTRMRCAHGFFFGIILAGTTLSWFPDAFTARSALGSMGELQAVLGSLGAWLSISLYFAVFGAAAGPLLRSPTLLTPLVGLPVLWTGLELLRGPYVPLRSNWVGNWLALAYGLPPDALESQVASLIGVYGLSLLVAASGTCFALLLREGRLSYQVGLALLGCALPLACHVYGRSVWPEKDPNGNVRVVVVAQEHNDLESLVTSTRTVERHRPSIVVWPSVPVLAIDDLTGTVLPNNPNFVKLRRDLPAILLAGVRVNKADEQRPPFTQVRVVSIGPDGAVLGSSHRPHEFFGLSRQPATPFDSPLGEDGRRGRFRFRFADHRTRADGPRRGPASQCDQRRTRLGWPGNTTSRQYAALPRRRESPLAYQVKRCNRFRLRPIRSFGGTSDRGSDRQRGHLSEPAKRLHPLRLVA